MGANFVRLTVVADEQQLDVSLPAQRPVVEYIDGLLELLGAQAAARGNGTVWTLSAPTLGPIELEDTLADHRIMDGSRLFLTAAPEAAAPPFVDDVLAEMRRRVDGRFAAWDAARRRTWLTLVAGVIVVAGSVLVACADARWPVAGVLAVVAVLTVACGLAARGSELSRVSWAAIAPAAIAAWRAAEGSGVAESVVFATAAAALVAAVAAAAVLRSAAVTAAAAVIAVVAAAVGVAFLLGANPVATSVWALPFLVIGVIVAPRVALASSGLLAQVRANERMELVKREDVARGLERGRVAADALVWSTSVIAVAAVGTIALQGVWEQGLAALLLVVIWLLRSRNFTHVRHVVPMLVAVAVGAVFLAAGLARWLTLSPDAAVVAVGVAVVVLALLAGVASVTSLDEVPAARLRRFYDAVDLPLALVFVPVVFFAQGVYSLVWPS